MNIKEKLASASKKERTPQQQKAMTILNWVATAVCIVVIVFALVVAIFTIAGTTNDDHLMRFGDKIYLNVASDSMEPTFSTSDVIIANAFNYEKQLAELKVGQVVTFKTTVRSGGNTYEVFNTHRIVRINFEENGTTVRNFTTRGDNSKSADKDNSKLSWKDAIAQNTLGLTETVAPSNIVATWGSVDADGNFTSGKMLKGVGGFSNWIQDTANFGAQQKTRFFCVVVLPQYGFSGRVMQIYPCLAAGYFILFILYAEIIFLYYFNDLTGALLATLGFCLVTWAGSVLSAGGSDLWYGMGLVAGSFTGFTIAYFRLRFMERHMDEHIFCGGQLFTVKRERMPESMVYTKKQKER